MMALGLLVLAGVAMPQPQQTASVIPAARPATTTAPAEKMICRRSANIGSNIPSRKICYTKAQWDMLSRDSQSMKRSMEPALTAPGGGG